MRELVRKFAGKGAALAVLALFVLAAAAPVVAQKNKDKQKHPPKTESPADSKSMPPMPDSKVVDQTVGEALGYWQIGDIDSLHKYYSNDVVVVSDVWEPPVIGWDNYLKAYQSQRARITGGRLDRNNTYIKVDGNSAWATYQFDYVVTVDGKLTEFRGHTTLILNKQGDRWVIALSHSSVVDSSITNPAAPANSGQPGRP